MDTINTLCEASKFFLSKAEECKTADKKNYYLISSILCSWILLEAYVNQTAETLSKAKKLQAHEKGYLLEKELKVNGDGLFQEHKSYPPTTKKALFLLNLFSKKNPKEIKQTKLWNELQECEKIRDNFIHPKGRLIQKTSLKKAAFFRKTIITLIKYLNKAIFQKQMRLY